MCSCLFITGHVGQSDSLRSTFERTALPSPVTEKHLMVQLILPACESDFGDDFQSPSITTKKCKVILSTPAKVR
jgi:hypothetical protein